MNNNVNRIHIYLDSGLNDKLDIITSKLGISKSDYIRKCLLNASEIKSDTLLNSNNKILHKLIDIDNIFTNHLKRQQHLFINVLSGFFSNLIDFLKKIDNRSDANSQVVEFMTKDPDTYINYIFSKSFWEYENPNSKISFEQSDEFNNNFKSYFSD